MRDLLEFYTKYWLPFGEVLTDMEREGIKLDTDYLKEIEMLATRDKMNYENKFLEWIHKTQTDAHEFNASSSH